MLDLWRCSVQDQRAGVQDDTSTHFESSVVFFSVISRPPHPPWSVQVELLGISEPRCWTLHHETAFKDAKFGRYWASKSVIELTACSMETLPASIAISALELGRGLSSPCLHFYGYLAWAMWWEWLPFLCPLCKFRLQFGTVRRVISRRVLLVLDGVERPTQ